MEALEPLVNKVLYYIALSLPRSRSYQGFPKDHLGENLLFYADREKDLGVHVNKRFKFNEQCEILLTKTNQKFGT